MCSKFDIDPVLKGSYIVCSTNESDNQILYEYGFGKYMRVSKLFPKFNVAHLDYYYDLSIVTDTGKLYSTWNNDCKFRKIKGFCRVSKVSCGSSHILVLTSTNHVYEINRYGKNKSSWKISLINGETPVDICASDNYSTVLGSKGNIYVYKHGEIELFHKIGSNVESISCMFYDECGYNLRIYVINNIGGIYKFTMVKNQHNGYRLIPKQYLPHNKILSIKCGNNHVIILTDDGEVYTAGNIDDDSGEIKVPQLVPNLDKLVIYDMVAKGNYSLAITNDGVYGWGCNKHGHLGPKLGTVVAIPTKIDSFENKIFAFENRYNKTKSANTTL